MAVSIEPYPIQVDLMRAARRAIDSGGIAVLESPTGTGKTLSLICSVLHWLDEAKRGNVSLERLQSGGGRSTLKEGSGDEIALAWAKAGAAKRANIRLA